MIFLFNNQVPNQYKIILQFIIYLVKKTKLLIFMKTLPYGLPIYHVDLYVLNIKSNR